MPQQSQAWKCSVCGYIHRGAEPPDWCPVCGAAKEDFEPYTDPAVVTSVPVVAFRCLNCDYVHGGSAAPDECPVCGSPSDRFRAADAVGAIETGKSGGTVIIVGAGVAGVAAAESVRKASEDTHIVLLAKETELPYYRLNLTRLLAGEVNDEELPLHPLGWYEEHSIRLLRGVEVTEIDLHDRLLTTRGAGQLAYTNLILTAGAHPFVPPVAGAYRQGVTSLRSLGDARRILEATSEGARVVCIGGGVLGLETAGALARRGARVTVLEGFDWILPRQLNRQAGEIMARFVSGLGITLIPRARTAEVLGDERAHGVRLEDGPVLPADLVVFATGVRANSYLARMAGLRVNQGVVVDDHLATSHPDVFAAGDVAEHRGVNYGTWVPAQAQGAIAGLNALGKQIEFGGIARSNTLKVLGFDMFSIGKVEPEDASYLELATEQEGHYYRFLFHDSHLVGAILLGDAERAAQCKRAIEYRTDFSALLTQNPSAGQVLAELAQRA